MLADQNTDNPDEDKNFDLDAFDEKMYKIASKNPIRVLGLLGRLYSLIDPQKRDMDFIQEEIEDLKIKEPEEEGKIKELKRTASKMEDKFNILSTKINSATYMYDVAG
eukprot:1116985-Ditylum_brightwellii.AAC.1